jgi:hypothetical protein
MGVGGVIGTVARHCFFPFYFYFLVLLLLWIDWQKRGAGVAAALLLYLRGRAAPQEQPLIGVERLGHSLCAFCVLV